MSNDEDQRKATKKKLKENFKTKELGEVSHILGVRVTRNHRAGRISVDQSAYIQEILERFNMSKYKPVSTPMDVNQELDEIPNDATEEELEEMSKVPYQEAVDALLYVSQATRPDIAHATSVLSKYNEAPRRIH